MDVETQDTRPTVASDEEGREDADRDMEAAEGAESEKEPSGSDMDEHWQTVTAWRRLHTESVTQRGINFSMPGTRVDTMLVQLGTSAPETTPDHQRPTPEAQEVPTQELRRIGEVYVPPDVYERTAEVLERHGLLVLQAPQGQGKRTTALRLLHEDGHEVWELPARGMDFESLRAAVRPGRRYLIDGMRSDALREDGEIDPFHLRGLVGDLAKRGSRLIVTVHGTLTDMWREHSQYLVQSESSPDREKVLTAHLRVRLPQADLEPWLRAPEVREQLRSNSAPGDVERIADRLASCIQQGSSLASCFESPEVTARRVAHELLAADSHPSRCALLLAVTVLGGCADRIVLDEAEKFEAAFCSGIPSEPPQRWQLGESRSKRLEAIHASVHRGVERRWKFRSSPVDTIDFDDRELAAQVLDVTWREHPPLRKPLLDWLKGIESHHTSSAVRGKVAAAVAELATISFGHVLEEVLEPWARAHRARSRQLAAEAFALTASSNDLAGTVFRLLGYWSQVRSSSHQFVAAIAFQRLCRDYPPESLDGLSRLIIRNTGESRDDQLDRAVDSALTEVLITRPALTLRRLISLTEPGEQPSVQRRALRAFLHLAGQWSANPTRPLLVQCWREDPRTQDPITALWHRTLQSTPLAASGAAMLRRWHRQATESGVEASLAEQLAWRIAAWQMASQSPAHTR